MYCVKRKTSDTKVAYYKYDGWEEFTIGEPIDLTGVVLFTRQEALNHAMQGKFDGMGKVEYQWYGSYKR